MRNVFSPTSIPTIEPKLTSGLILGTVAPSTSFGNQATANLFNGINSRNSRKIPSEITQKTLNKLDILNAVEKLEEFLQPMNITQETLATYLNISIKRINEIIQEKDKITPEIAWLLAQTFNTTPQF